MQTLRSIFLACVLLMLHLGTLNAQWIQTNGPYGGAISCFAASGTNLFAGTFSGGIFLSTNNGTSWTAVNSGLPNTTVRSLLVSGTNLFAGTDVGVFLSTNNGTSWTGGAPIYNVLALAVSGTNLFAGTYGGVFLSTNNGTSWTAVNSGLTNTTVPSLAVSGTNLFAGTAGGVFLSTNNGTSWTSVGLTSEVIDAFAVSGTNLFAGTGGGGVFLSINNGTSWTAVNSGLISTSVRSFAVSGTNLFAGTFGSGFFLSTNNGTSWTADNSGLTNAYILALAVSGTNLFAGTMSGGTMGDGVFLSTNNGTSWTASGLTSTSVNALAVLGTNLFAGTYDGVFLSTNNGTSWTAVNSGLTSTSVVSLAVLGTNLFAGTLSAGVFLSTNNGTSWTEVNTGLMSYFNIYALAVSGTNLFAGTYGGGVFLSTNNGTSWTAVNSGLTNTLVYSLAVSGTNLFAGTVGSGGGVFLSTNNGTSWTLVNSGLTNISIYALAVSGTNLFAGPDGGGVWRRPLSEIITSLPSPAGPITGLTTVCANSTTTYSVGSISGATSYVWSVPTGASITAGQGTTGITVNYGASAVSGNVSVYGTNSAGNGAYSQLPVAVNPPATPTLSGPASVCVNSTGNVYTTQTGMSNYVWTVSAGGTPTAGGTATSSSVTVTWNAIGAQNVSVNYTNANGCTAVTSVVYPVTVNSGAAPTITGSTTLCVNSGYYTYTTEAGMTDYTWTISAGGVINYGAGTNVITVSWTASGAQWVRVNYTNPSGCQTYNPTQLNITVNTLPGPAGTITGTATVCGGANGVAYSIATVTGASTYVWILPAGATIASGANTNSITVNFAANASSGNITVYADNTCGNGAASPPFAITVTPLPAAAGNITGPASVCQGVAGVVYTVPAIAGATGYTWAVPAGATIVSGGNTNSITVDFSAAAISGNITVLGTNSCGNGTVSPNFAVTVNAIPPTPVVTNTGTTLYSSAPTGNQWYFEGTLIVGATAQTYVATQDGYYWSIVTLNGCSSAESNHLQIFTTGVDSHSSSAINIYPVPNDGRFNVSITTASNESFSISVYNSLGVKIYEETKVEVNGSLQKVIDLRPVPNGVYSVVVRNSLGQVVRKIIVNR